MMQKDVLKGYSLPLSLSFFHQNNTISIFVISLLLECSFTDLLKIWSNQRTKRAKKERHNYYCFLSTSGKKLDIDSPILSLFIFGGNKY